MFANTATHRGTVTACRVSGINPVGGKDYARHNRPQRALGLNRWLCGFVMFTASCRTIGELRLILDDLAERLGDECEWYGYEDESLMITKLIDGDVCDVAVIAQSDAY